MNKIQLPPLVRKVSLLSASFLLFFSSCKKDGELNPEFAKNSSIALFTNEIPITTKTVKTDSILTDNLSTALIGEFQDSVFGNTKASCYFQVLLSSNALKFGENIQLLSTDSVVLSLEYNGYYGDLTQSQTFEVYRLEEELNEETSYYSNSNVQTQSTILGNSTFVPNLDSMLSIKQPNTFGGIDSIKVNPQLRIRLDNAIGDEILSKSDQAEVSNNENFTQFIKGLKVESNSSPTMDNTNAILYFALTASNSKMTVYYHDDTTAKSIDFPINSSSVRFNSFEHDHSGTPVELALNSSQDSLYSHLMAMSSVETIIRFSDINQFFNGERVLVNKAELFIPAVNDSYLVNDFASSLIVVTEDESGTLQFIPDFFEGSSYFGGNFDAISQTYKFNITRYIQGLINGSISNNELVLLVTGSGVKSERVVIYGPKNPSNKIKLNLYYSKTQ